MDKYLETFSSISVLVMLICIVVLFRFSGVLKKEDGMLFSKIVTHITLPAVIFSVMSHSKALEWEYALAILFVLLSEILVLLMAWFIGIRLNISNEKLGTLMIVSAFGSSALLGYAVIGEVFPSNVKALSEAVLISELGVGIGFFTIGTMVAVYFGTNTSQKQTPLQIISIFLISPIFLSIIAGLAYSLLNLPTQIPIIKEIFDAISLISKANTFFVALTVGVILQFNSLRSIISLAIVVVLLKLLVSPLLVWIASFSLDLSSSQLEVVMIESAMPSAMLSVVLAKRYGCDAELASKLVFITTIFSILTIPLLLGAL
ncbi:AEC family transporter [Sulfurimonas sp.]|uniref:AEC family transporter n=1 Tax=Sulfurimonas sp. TaxID=2022749 RepID=UPI002AB08E88|nr:AEC family transporter [Sulfurimonas sp.]